jgi:hypothetical protein
MIKKSAITVGTWSVRRVLQAREMHKVAQEMIPYKTDIMVLQDMRWPGR